MSSTRNLTQIERQLLLHEGERLSPYRCTSGKLTIGIGRNLDDKGISADESLMLLRNDIAEVLDALREKLPWFNQLSEIRQAVLIDMGFNLGIGGLLEFKNTLAAIKRGAYKEAARLMLKSKWARQVGQRARRLARMMETDEEQRE